MTHILHSTRQILKPTQEINCHSLSAEEKRPYKYCMQHPTNNEAQHPDKRWSEFLQAQKNLSANCIYKWKTLRNAQDCTPARNEAVSTETINQCLPHMSYIAGLLKDELFYLLSFMLNLAKLPGQMQKQYMEHMVYCKLLDVNIINYFQMISKHPAIGLDKKPLQQLQQALQHAMDKVSCTGNMNYYNPEHIFIKSVKETINPYELAYLNAILHSDKKLTSPQSMYLAKFLFKLQQLDHTTREEYMKFFREQRILSFNRFEYLVVFVVSRAKRIDHGKLKKLLGELHYLMGVVPREPQPEDKTISPKTKKPHLKAIKIDYLKIHNTLTHLMKSSIPNIVRLTYLRNFLIDMLTLADEQILGVFNNLKVMNIMTPSCFNYVEDFVAAGKLGKVDPIKQKVFIELLRQVAGAPNNMEIIHQLDIPASKGPVKVKINKNEDATNKIALD